MKRVLVETTIEQVLEVSDNTTLDDVLEFLANSQSFRESIENLETKDIKFLDIIVTDEKAQFYID